MNKILVICGPTATGKTALAVRLAQKLNGELVSADSRQVYRGMDIGTGKDLESRKSKIENRKSTYYKDRRFELFSYDIQGIPIWMYDVVDPDEDFSVAVYQRLALAVIADIQKRGKTPIIVGGTGLYIKSLQEPIDTITAPPNKKLRNTLAQKSLIELQQLLQSSFPDVWSTLNTSDQQNPRRLIRKIEIEYYGIDHKETDSKIENRKSRIENYMMIGLTAPYQELYKRIDERVEKRVEQGVMLEIQSLHDKGYGWNLPSMSGLGYKEWQEYFNNPGEVEKKKAIERWKFDEHGYARRQLTWFRKQKSIKWFTFVNNDRLINQAISYIT
jgi:tRNA dimethylallyltransferase